MCADREPEAFTALREERAVSEGLSAWRFERARAEGALAEGCSRLDSVISDFQEDHRIPGLAAGVVDDQGLVWSSGYGRVRWNGSATPDSSHIFRIASMSKSVTALAMLMLRDRGLVSLDDEVRSLLPEIEVVNSEDMESERLSVRHLLSMASGFVEDDPWADRQLDLDAEAFSRMLRSGVMLSLPTSVSFEYSNFGYALLGRIFQVVAGEPVQRFTEREIFEPLGMTETTWDVLGSDLERVVPGHRLRHGEFEIEPSLGDGAFAPMGGLATSIRDLSRLVGLHLSAWSPRESKESGLVRRSTLREMAQVQRGSNGFPLPDPQGYAFLGYGYGLSCSAHERFGRVVGHGGALPGFSSYMEWLPECGVGILVLTNRTYRPTSVLVRSCFASLAREGLLERRTLEPSQALRSAQRFVVGLYEGRSIEELCDVDTLSVGALETLTLDLDDDRRYPDFASLSQSLGTILEVGSIRAQGGLRGSWSLVCERGRCEVSVMIGPIVPLGIQFIAVRVVSD
jgi:CubicO group peptidase (beta-lactamase class C family)